MPRLAAFPFRTIRASAALAALTIFSAPVEVAFGAGSAPVTVVNPDTSPVPTTVVNPATSPALTSNVNDPGRIAYQSSMNSFSGVNCASNSPAPNQCSIVFPSVPQGHRLVIQYVTGVFPVTGTPNTASVQLSAPAIVGPTFLGRFATDTSVYSVVFNEPVLFFVDAGLTPQVFVEVLSASGVNIIPIVNVTLTGYLLDCTIAPCAAIAK